jgi:Xaa-Pro aminopeptidase
VSRATAVQAPLERLERAAGELRARELDALLVTGAANVRYTTGFTGTSGVALIAAEAGAGSSGGGGGLRGHRFITDFRYATQVGAEVAAAFEREVVNDNLLEGVAGALGAGGGRLGFLEKSLTVADHARLRELLPEQWQLVPAAAILEELRAVKDAAEVARIRAACELADEALRSVLEGGLVGRSERDVALELEWQMRRRGAERPSFPTIVAAAAHAALPHAQPREREIPPDVLVIVDWGALHDGYCSDCTRTYASGEHISDQARAVYELVRSAQARAAAAVRAGAGAHALDAIARSVIDEAGYGEQFGHGLGHGVGMEIHEGPRLSRTAPDEPVRCGNVVTVEPGVYLRGELGVRIEDLLVVREDGHEILTGLPRELVVVG